MSNVNNKIYNIATENEASIVLAYFDEEQIYDIVSQNLINRFSFRIA